MCLLGVSDLPRITEPQWGPPNPENISILKYVFYSPYDAEKFAYFNGTIIFEIQQKMADMS